MRRLIIILLKVLLFSYLGNSHREANHGLAILDFSTLNKQKLSSQNSTHNFKNYYQQVCNLPVSSILNLNKTFQFEELNYTSVDIRSIGKFSEQDFKMISPRHLTIQVTNLPNFIIILFN